MTINLPILHNCYSFLLHFLFVWVSLVSSRNSIWCRDSFQNGIHSWSALRSFHLIRKVTIWRLPGLYLRRSGHGIVLLLFFIVSWESPRPFFRRSNIVWVGIEFSYLTDLCSQPYQVFFYAKPLEGLLPPCQLWFRGQYNLTFLRILDPGEGRKPEVHHGPAGPCPPECHGRS